MPGTDFGPHTFAENPEESRMRYYPREASPFWVEVVSSKGGGRIETRKYRGEPRAIAAEIEESLI
jgi:hypothetical protein